MTDFAFLHGGGQGGWVWGETIAAMQAQQPGAHRYLALDAPGCGTKRDRDTSAIAFGEIAPELIADIEAAGMTLPHIAELRPDLLRKLVYLTCSAPQPGKTTIEKMGGGLHGAHPDEVGWPIDPETSTMDQRFRAMFCNDMRPAEADAFLARLGQDMWPNCCYTQRDWRFDHLEAIPSTFILCHRDMSLPPDWQERFAEQLHCDKTVYLDAGHQAMNTRPHGLAEILLAEALA